MDEVVLISLVREGGHPKIGAIGHLDLDLLGFCFLIKSVGGTYGIGGRATDFPFLHSKDLRPSKGDLRLEIMAYCQSGVSKIRHLKDNLGGTHRIL